MSCETSSPLDSRSLTFIKAPTLLGSIGPLWHLFAGSLSRGKEHQEIRRNGYGVHLDALEGSLMLFDTISHAISNFLPRFQDGLRNHISAGLRTLATAKQTS